MVTVPAAAVGMLPTIAAPFAAEPATGTQDRSTQAAPRAPGVSRQGAPQGLVRAERTAERVAHATGRAVHRAAATGHVARRAGRAVERAAKWA
jgi:hypothetical protein